jgi:hypothetical protein
MSKAAYDQRLNYDDRESFERLSLSEAESFAERREMPIKQTGFRPRNPEEKVKLAYESLGLWSSN